MCYASVIVYLLTPVVIARRRILRKISKNILRRRVYTHAQIYFIQVTLINKPRKVTYEVFVAKVLERS